MWTNSLHAYHDLSVLMRPHITASLQHLFASYLHSVYFFMLNKFVQVIQVIPPLKKKGLCYQFEPWRNFNFIPGSFVQELFQFFLCHIAVALDLVGVRIQCHILLHK